MKEKNGDKRKKDRKIHSLPLHHSVYTSDDLNMTNFFLGTAPSFKHYPFKIKVKFCLRMKLYLLLYQCKVKALQND